MSAPSEQSLTASTAPRTDTPSKPGMIDPFGRHISYLRLSVTDRCDLRCAYCMSERMTFLPKSDLLSLEELDALATAFISRGVDKLRLTGGEPLVRRGVITLIERLSRHLATGALRELTLTTNATRLGQFAKALRDAGVERVNVSLDSLDPDIFARITRRAVFSDVMAGIDAAQAAGLRVKINTVALKRDNAGALADMIAWAHGRGMDMTLIEAMPMGEIDEDRVDQYAPLSDVRADLEKHWTLTPETHRTGGPARYVRVAETGGRLGFITPLSGNFCDGCNRMRVTCTGRLFMCLGQEDAADLRAVTRAAPDDHAALDAAIDEALTRKPRGHDFVIDQRGAGPASPRHMSVTGG